MFSLTPPKLTTIFHHHHRSISNHRNRRLHPILSSSRQPPSPPPQPAPGSAYQPFRPPPTPLPSQYSSLSPAQILSTIRDRLGLWHDYAPLISSLSNTYSPADIENSTGLSPVDQNRLQVASRVRSSLVPSLPPNLLPFFDSASSADSLYALRLLSSAHRLSAAIRVATLNLDARQSDELARAMKDFPRRRGENGWDEFSSESPGDCLAFTYFRLSREALSQANKVAALEKALEAADTERARKRIGYEMERVTTGGNETVEYEKVKEASVPVLRLKYGEVSEAESVALLPVCRAADGEAGVEGAPSSLSGEGELGVVQADKGWGRWVVLPGWGPVLGIGGQGGVAVEFADDAKGIPWGKRLEEGVLVVVDRKRKEVADEYGFYLVADGEGLVVERGKALTAKGVKQTLGSVVVVVRPPKEEDDQLADEDWD